jgi:hypothetical protein
MTDNEVREAILLAILDCELEDARGDRYPAIREVETAKKLGTALFNALNAKGLLMVVAG